jgi:hypothetical protein
MASVIQSGFGFVVGESGETIYVVTANHLVRDDQSDPASQIEVSFFEDQGKKYQGELLSTAAPIEEGDIAVIRLQPPSGFSWRHDARASKIATRGDDVWYVGRSGEWYVPTRPGVITGVRPSGTILAEELNVRVGSSGAPLIGPSGIIGMIVDSNDYTAMAQRSVEGISHQTTEATPIEVIESFFRKWNHPWQITPVISGPSSPTTGTSR